MRRKSLLAYDPGPGRNSRKSIMTNKTQTISKTTVAKKGAPAQKAAPKAVAQKAAPKAVAQKTAPTTAGIVAMIVEGISKRIEAKSPFYATALAYHTRNRTQFPRTRNNETRAALKVEDVATVFDQHDKKILASGNAKGQAMFDVYMMSKG